LALVSITVREKAVGMKKMAARATVVTKTVNTLT